MSSRTDWTDLPPAPEALPGPVVDTHCHLDITAELSGLDPDDALARAAAVGITRVAQIGCDVEQSRWAVDFARRHPSVVAGVALHPNDAARLGASDPAALAEGLAVVESLAGDPEVRVVGETGLDFFRTPDGAGQAFQRESFAAHIAMAKAHDRTLMIHDRDAHDAVLDVLDAEGVPDRVVMHCFSGDEVFARACLDRGAHLSFAGTVTFKANAHLRRALAVAPLEKVLVETDAPFLTPLPVRGRPNASYLIPYTARVMAEVRQLPLEELCAALTANAEAALGGTWPAYAAASA
ncbi:TatD family hydrolase [Microlunatus flavus]|uniref:TatD DNase family protein n=1 Tax=Microlunatus flavus TaxID=1036181 RepID=A0A1H9K445_9ACTN|nr:TatD family hydrolase [Microlunatus flavus]SEQ93615.1 TatD DNase family protein [Microlunatus flavus]